MNSLVQVLSSIAIAFSSLVISIFVNHHLNYLDRNSYGICMVLLGQIFLFAQLGLPGVLTITGLSPLKFAKKSEISQLMLRRFIPFAILTILICNLNRLDVQTSFITLLGYLTLIPAQWLISAFQKHVSNIEYSCWRILPTLFQLLSVFLGAIFIGILNLHFFVSCWFIGNLLVTILTIARSRRIGISNGEIHRGLSLGNVAQLGKSGFLPHIGVSDLIRLETYLIPLVEPVYSSAKYFAVVGLSNWTRILVDGLSISIIPKYVHLSFQEARALALRRTIYTFIITVFALVACLTLCENILQLVVSNKYGSVSGLFFAFSTALLLSSLRRMYLDAFRTHGLANSKAATRFEIQCWVISIIPLPILFSHSSMEMWAWLTLCSNFAALCFLVYRGQRWINAEE